MNDTAQLLLRTLSPRWEIPKGREIDLVFELTNRGSEIRGLSVELSGPALPLLQPLSLMVGGDFATFLEHGAAFRSELPAFIVPAASVPNEIRVGLAGALAGSALFHVRVSAGTTSSGSSCETERIIVVR